MAHIGLFKILLHKSSISYAVTKSGRAGFSLTVDTLCSEGAAGTAATCLRVKLLIN